MSAKQLFNNGRRFTEDFIATTTGTGTESQIQVSLAHQSLAESQTRDELLQLLVKYNLSDWLWTHTVLIDQDRLYEILEA
ncbi:MAG: hypothetical protein JO331_02005 [Verrucomicrobia bacterium]|nr:hypothetical protein [Verrucomicrobiota bacterium]